MMQKRSGLGNATLLAAGLLLLLFEGGATAQSDTVTLLCEGKVAAGTHGSTPVSISIVLNLTTGTVQQDFVPYPVKITRADDRTLEFTGSHFANGIKFYAHGSMDRVNGNAGVITVLSDQKTDKELSSMLYSLNCKPTKRMF